MCVKLFRNKGIIEESTSMPIAISITCDEFIEEPMNNQRNESSLEWKPARC
jgi:hypothetical protein